VDGVNGKKGDGNRGARLFTGLEKMFFRTGEEKFPDRGKRAAIALLFDFYLSNAAKTKKYDYLCGNIHYIIIHLYRDERFY